MQKAEVDEEMAEEGKTQESEIIVPVLGSAVYGRINKVEDRFVRVEILAVEEKPLPKNVHFTGIIFKENVRDYDRDGL